MFAFFFSRSVFAANIELSAEKNVFQKNEVFTITILLNTEGQSINTLEGDLKYDANFIKAENINIGGSFINFWVEKPDIKTPGVIHFSGITPGGVSVAQGEIFKVIFQTQKTGNTLLSLDSVNLFLNDGQGSTVLAKIKNENIIINQGVNDNVPANFAFNDKISPEKFNIIRTKDPAIFDGKWFIVFSTIDKESGVDHYQVCEFFKCTIAESPFLLKNQTPFYRIDVKAYDMNGNFTSSTLTSPWLIILLVFLFFVGIIYLCFPKNLTARRNLARK